LAPGPTVASASCMRTRQEMVPPSRVNPIQVGDKIEVSMDSMAVVSEIASILAKRRGGALIIDYGENDSLQDSLRVSSVCVCV
jgi:SAM-dependent MidA family methyltransferase